MRSSILDVPYSEIRGLLLDQRRNNRYSFERHSASSTSVVESIHVGVGLDNYVNAVFEPMVGQPDATKLSIPENTDNDVESDVIRYLSNMLEKEIRPAEKLEV